MTERKCKEGRKEKKGYKEREVGREGMKEKVKEGGRKREIVRARETDR